MATKLSTLHLDYTSSDPAERAKVRVVVRHTDDRGIQYDEALMLDAANIPALRDVEPQILAQLGLKIGKPVEVLPVADVVPVVEDVEPITEP